MAFTTAPARGGTEHGGRSQHSRRVRRAAVHPPSLSAGSGWHWLPAMRLYHGGETSKRLLEGNPRQRSGRFLTVSLGGVPGSPTSLAAINAARRRGSSMLLYQRNKAARRCGVGSAIIASQIFVLVLTKNENGTAESHNRGRSISLAASITQARSAPSLVTAYRRIASNQSLMRSECKRH